MSHTLILRLAGPMQSWGVSSRFGIRETQPEPSKSGVIGLLCAALGWDRANASHPVAGQERSLADLANLPFGIRVVWEGILQRDYHTAQDVLRANAQLKPGQPANPGDLQKTVLSERYYLSDAHFLAGFESQDVAMLLALEAALANPFWPLCLGRKAFVPAWPVGFKGPEGTGVVHQPLAKALLEAVDPVLELSTHRRVREVKGKENVATRTTRLVMDSPLHSDESGTFLESSGYIPIRSALRTDVPLSFFPRQFAPREVTTYTHVSV